MGHLLVTNDFPPKIGGIQSYLWELWRRLPPERVTVFTTPYAGADAFDKAAPFPIVRSRQKVLLPTPAVLRHVVALAREHRSDLVVLDPALPLGWLAPALEKRGIRTAVVVHGAEVTVPGRLPVTRQLLGRVLRATTHVIAAGGYPKAEAEHAAGRALDVTVVPPGVDTDRLQPLDGPARAAARAHLGLPAPGERPVVAAASRLVPRKGMDTVIEAAARVAADHPGLVVAISGAGRDRPRLERLAAKVATGAPLDVRFLGRLPDDDLARLYGSADVFAMLCRNRWFGLEQEGFGIVFLEAAACGVAQVAGDSGGAAEAVDHGRTGLVVSRPVGPDAAADALRALLGDDVLRRRLGTAARERAVAEFSYDRLAARLDAALLRLESGR